MDSTHLTFAQAPSTTQLDAKERIRPKAYLRRSGGMQRMHKVRSGQEVGVGHTASGRSELPRRDSKGKMGRVASDVRLSLDRGLQHGSTLNVEPSARRSGSLIRDAVKQKLLDERSEAATLAGEPEYVKFCRKMVESKRGIFCVLLISMYSLIADDVRLMFTSRPADVVFDVLATFCLVVLTLEIILSSVGKDDYLMGFFFIMDVICTVTIFLDFTAVSEWMVVGDEENVDIFKQMKVATSHRIVRTCRQFRIIKLYKGILLSRGFAHKKSRMDAVLSPGDDPNHGEDGPSVAGDTQVGKKLTELTVRRVALLVLVLTIVLPMCSVGLEKELPTSLSYGVEVVFSKFRAFEKNPLQRTAYENALLRYLYSHNWFTRASGCEDDKAGCPADYYSGIFWMGVTGESEQSVLAMSQMAQLTRAAVSAFNIEASLQRSMYRYGSMPDMAVMAISSPWTTTCNAGAIFRKGISLLENADEWGESARCPEDLRAVERTKYGPRFITRSQFKDWHFSFYIDDRPFVKVDALLNLVGTFFICLALWVQSLLLSIDASVLLLKPLEKMVLTVNMIRINPFIAKELAHDAEKRDMCLKVRNSKLLLEKGTVKKLRRLRRCILCKPRPQTQIMETRILENTIVKLGLLLMLGFGEAGSNIIGRNLIKSDSAFVNAMVPGCQVQCIIGIARIRNFGIVTEVLANDVMTFVNKVAEIVHGLVDEYHGGANRMTIGDSFLLIWTMDGFSSSTSRALADMSVVAFTRVYAEVHSSLTLQEYHNHPSLQKRLGSKSPINLSFGLHYGMAVEGAVGTEFKIDACYVSSNVSVAESIERSTETYAVNILVTGALMKLCTPCIKRKCRQIDRVVVKGCTEPMDIYVMDMSSKFGLFGKQPHLGQYKASEVVKSRKWLTESLEEDFANEYVQAMREPYTVEFIELFNMAFQNYIEGEWLCARRILSRTQYMLGFEDGPSSCLLRFMAKFDYQPTKDWKGYHALRFLQEATPGIHTSMRSSFVIDEQEVALKGVPLSDYLQAEAATTQIELDANAASGTPKSDAECPKKDVQVRTVRVKRKGGQTKLKKTPIKRPTSNPDVQLKPARGSLSTLSTSASSLGSPESGAQTLDREETPGVRRKVTAKWKKTVTTVEAGMKLSQVRVVSTNLPLDDFDMDESPNEKSQIADVERRVSYSKKTFARSPPASPRLAPHSAPATVSIKTHTSGLQDRDDTRPQTASCQILGRSSMEFQSFTSTGTWANCPSVDTERRPPLDVPETLVEGRKTRGFMQQIKSDQRHTKTRARKTWKKAQLSVEGDGCKSYGMSDIADDS